MPITGTADISTAGTFVDAIQASINSNYGKTQQVIGDTTFHVLNSNGNGQEASGPGFISIVNADTTGFDGSFTSAPPSSVAYSNVLYGCAFSQGTGVASVNLSGLSSGHQYQVQIWNSTSPATEIDKTIYSGVTQLELGGSSYSLGTFTATGATQSFNFTTAPDGDGYGVITAVALRDVSAPPPPHGDIPQMTWATHAVTGKSWPEPVRSDWINVLDYGATGDGVHDDTAGIQAALNAAVANATTPTVYFPPGTYKITSTLQATNFYGNSLIGCGLNTTIKWYGPAGGAMIQANGDLNTLYKGFVWNGNGNGSSTSPGATGAGCAFLEYSNAVGSPAPNGSSRYMTQIRHEDESFQNFNVATATYLSGHTQPTAAIVSGFSNPQGSVPVGELTTFNCRFYNCTTAIENAVEIINNFMWVVDGCEFDNNGTGFNGGNGYCYVLLNSHFQQSSVVDITGVGSIHAHRITSTGSAMFCNVAGTNVFDDCWIDGWTYTPGAMEFEATGQSSIVNCTFTTPPSGASSPVFTIINTGNQMNLLLSGNTSTAFPGTSLVHQYGVLATVELTPPGSMTGNVTNGEAFLHSATINDSTHILDVSQAPYSAPAGTGTDATSAIQSAITAAKNANNGSIVYLPTGKTSTGAASAYLISSTLNVSGSNYTIQGGGLWAVLGWTGGTTGSMMAITTPTNLAVKNIRFGTTSNTVNSILETSTGASSITYDNVICDAFDSGNQENPVFDANCPGIVLSSLPAGSTVNIPVMDSPLTVTNCGPAKIFSTMAYIGAVNVAGATQPKTGYLGMAVAEGAQQSTSTYNFTINDNQSLLIGSYYTENAANDLDLLRGSGTTPGAVAIFGLNEETYTPSASINVNNYAGRLFYSGQFFYNDAGWAPVSIAHTGTNPFNLILANDFFNFSAAPNLSTLGTGAKLIATLNWWGQGGSSRFTLTDTPNPLTSANLASIAQSIDDFTQLGALNLAVEYSIVNPSGLVAYWKLDETATPSVDSSMSGATGTWVNSPTVSTSTPTAIPYTDPDCITLNGTNQYVSMGNPANLPTGTGARTICGWAKSTTTAAGLRVIASFGTAATSEAMYIGMNGTSLVAGGDNNDLTVTGFWDTNWHFIVLTYNGTTANLYADGVLKATSAKTWNLVHSSCNIGAFVNATDFWKGNVDDVRVYNYALTAAQVSALQ